MLRSMYGCTCLLDRCRGSHHPLPCHFWRECSPPSCTNDIPSVNPVCISCPDIHSYTQQSSAHQYYRYTQMSVNNGKAVQHLERLCLNLQTTARNFQLISLPQDVKIKEKTFRTSVSHSCQDSEYLEEVCICLPCFTMFPGIYLGHLLEMVFWARWSPSHICIFSEAHAA